MLTELRKKVESKRSSEKLYWKSLVKTKDLLWLPSKKAFLVFGYFFWRFIRTSDGIPYGKELRRQLTPYDVSLFKEKMRLGSLSDGGYVVPVGILPLFDAVYTYGVGYNISFESDLVKRRPVPVKFYDHTVKKLPIENKNFFFKAQGISDHKYDAFDTFGNHLVENRDISKKIFLKMDIEGDEWGVIGGIVETHHKNIVAIVLEIHWLDEFVDAKRYIDVLKKINSRFTLVHIHGNNNCPILDICGKAVPSVCELTFINTDLVDSKSIMSVPLPSELDYPVIPSLKDVELDFWK